MNTYRGQPRFIRKAGRGQRAAHQCVPDARPKLGYACGGQYSRAGGTRLDSAPEARRTRLNRVPIVGPGLEFVPRGVAGRRPGDGGLCRRQSASDATYPGFFAA